MIVCVCKAVSDRHIRAAVTDGAVCMRDLARDLKVGTGCGKCVPDAKATLSACLSQAAASGLRRDERLTAPFFPNPTTEFAV